MNCPYYFYGHRPFRAVTRGLDIQAREGTTNRVEGIIQMIESLLAFHSQNRGIDYYKSIVHELQKH